MGIVDTLIGIWRNFSLTKKLSVGCGIGCVSIIAVWIIAVIILTSLTILTRDDDVYTCEGLAKEAIALSEERVSSSRNLIVEIYDLEITLDRVEEEGMNRASKRMLGQPMPRLSRVFECEGWTKFGDGSDADITIYIEWDSEGDSFIGYNAR